MMTPIQVLDELLTEVQTFPLDAQHYNKLIISSDRVFRLNSKKYSQLSKKILLKLKSKEKYLRKIEKREESVRECLRDKLTASSKIHGIVCAMRDSLRSKIVKADENFDFGVPSINNIPNVLRTGNRSAETSEAEPVYCICKQKSYGDMIGCDSSDCKIGWFHFPCVGLGAAPKGSWFCSECKKKRRYSRLA
jgi:hypothetical protein